MKCMHKKFCSNQKINALQNNLCDCNNFKMYFKLSLQLII